MKIVIGSANVPKREAVIEAFSRAYKGQNIDVDYVTTDSAVSSHPTSTTEAMQGALNRVADAKRQVQKADYYVGIEGGLMQSDGRAWEIGWVAISNYEGNANGYNGLATNDLVTRQQAYVQGDLFALAQFLHPELYK